MFFLSLLSIAYNFEIAYENSSFATWHAQPDSYYNWDFNPDNTNIGSEFNVEFRCGKSIYGYAGGSTYISAIIQGDNLITETSPELGSFGLYAGIRSKHFDVGFDYNCLHGMYPYMDDTQILDKREGARWKIFFKFNGEWRYK